jgi:hypothetical protein
MRDHGIFFEANTIESDMAAYFAHEPIRRECATWARRDLTDTRWRPETGPSLDDEVAYTGSQKQMARFHTEYGFEAEQCGCIFRLVSI